MAIKLDMLRCFVTVAESGNLADAATRLNRSPSAVSMMLKQFEQHLGRSLFESDRKNSLSTMGRFVLEQAQIELRQFDWMVQSIESFARTEIGVVRVASVPSVAGTILPVAIKRFIARHPRIRIDLRDMDSASVLRALEQERVDIGIATAHEQIPDQRRTRLFADAFGLVCLREHPLAQSSTPLRWQALEGEEFIANELCGSLQSPVFQHIYRNARLNVHNTVSLLAMVKAGLGVTVLPQMVLQLHPGELYFRAIDDASALRQIDLLYRTGTGRAPAADSLGEFIVAATEDCLRGECPKRTTG
jgi:DNA-binding transcriptional LysR family regulator